MARKPRRLKSPCGNSILNKQASGLKPHFFCKLFGTAEAVPYKELANFT